MTLDDDDDDVRSRLHVDAAGISSDIPASVVFGQLRPRLRRARRRRRIAVGTTSFVLIGGAGVALQVGLNSRSTSIHTYGDSTQSPGVDKRTTDPIETDDPEQSSDPAWSSPSEISAYTTSTATPSTSTSAPAPAGPGVGVPATPIPGPPPGPTTIPVTDPTATVVDSTIATTTSVVAVTPPLAASSSTQIDSACGSVVVETVDDRVDLVDVMANPGFTVDVRSDGPDDVEVGLHGGNDECELEARVIGGQLVTSVHGPESHAPGADDSPDDP